MTSRQFYIALAIIVVCIKIQKFPCLLAGATQKNGYVLILAYFLINLLCIALGFYVLKKTKNKSFQYTNSKGMKLLKNAFLILLTLYFFTQGILLYEAIQDLFAHILFDNLPWTLFSLLLIIAVFFLANRGVTCIARNFELYAFIIIASLIAISVFGGMETSFTNIFPLQDISLSQVFSNFVKFNTWFGDFFLVIALGKVSKDIKFKWTILTYIVAIAFVILVDIEFYGIYGAYASLQPSLVSVISEQSMLGVNIGRIDWFLILFSQIGTILGSATCFFFAKTCLAEVFKKVNPLLILGSLIAVLYVFDAFVLVDIHIKEVIFFDYICYFTAAMNILIILVLIVFALKKEKNDGVQSNANKALEKGNAKVQKKLPSQKFSQKHNNQARAKVWKICLKGT